MSTEEAIAQGGPILGFEKWRNKYEKDYPTYADRLLAELKAKMPDIVQLGIQEGYIREDIIEILENEKSKHSRRP